jgi:Protein of unknown function (DUF2793)
MAPVLWSPPLQPETGTARVGRSLAAFQDGAWAFYGWTAWVADEHTLVIYAASTWTPYAGPDAGCEALMITIGAGINENGSVDAMINTDYAADSHCTAQCDVLSATASCRALLSFFIRSSDPPGTSGCTFFSGSADVVANLLFFGNFVRGMCCDQERG